MWTNASEKREKVSELKDKAAVASYAGTGEALVTSRWSVEGGAEPESLAAAAAAAVGAPVQAHPMLQSCDAVRLTDVVGSRF